MKVTIKPKCFKFDKYHIEITHLLKTNTQFKTAVINTITSSLKKYSLIEKEEIKNFFSTDQLYCTTLLYFFLQVPQKNYQAQFTIDVLSVIEMFVKVKILHQSIKDIDSFSNIEKSKSHETQLLPIEIQKKNTKKILLGDTLISTAINIINCFPESFLKKKIHIFSQKIFLQNIQDQITPHTFPALKTSKTPTNWFLFLPYLLNDSYPKTKELTKFFTKLSNQLFYTKTAIMSILPYLPENSIDGLSQQEKIDFNLVTKELIAKELATFNHIKKYCIQNALLNNLQSEKMIDWILKHSLANLHQHIETNPKSLFYSIYQII